MTPKSFDAALVVTRLEAMSVPLAVLKEVGQVSAAQLETDIIMRLAVERALTQLVEVGSDIAAHILVAHFSEAVTNYASSFAVLADKKVIGGELSGRLKNAAKMRNVLTHMYLEIDYAVVAVAVPQALGGFSQFRRDVSRWLQGHDDH